MSGRRAMCLQRVIVTICMWSSLMLLLAAAPMPKNFFDQSNQVAEFFQKGAALLPSMGMDSKGDLRRKRSLDDSALAPETGPKTSFTQLMRNINAPCIGGGTGGGTTPADGGDDIVDEARRRIARMKARKAAAGKKAKNTKSKSKSGRRRRQTEVDDLEGLGENEEKKFEKEFMAHMQHFSENMNRVYEHIASSVMEAMKRMEEKFGGDGGRS